MSTSIEMLQEQIAIEEGYLSAKKRLEKKMSASTSRLERELQTKKEYLSRLKKEVRSPGRNTVDRGEKYEAYSTTKLEITVRTSSSDDVPPHCITSANFPDVSTTDACNLVWAFKTLIVLRSQPGIILLESEDNFIRGYTLVLNSKIPKQGILAKPSPSVRSRSDDALFAIPMYASEHWAQQAIECVGQRSIVNLFSVLNKKY